MESVRLRGRLVSGRGEGAFFTEVVWAQRVFVRTLGFKPHPGTVNIRLDPANAAEANRFLEAVDGYPMTPPEGSGFCAARCYRGRLEDKISAGLVVPLVPDYYADILEILAPVNVREALAVSDGAALEIEIFGESGVTEGN